MFGSRALTGLRYWNYEPADQPPEPSTSIALGDSTVPLSDRNANYLDEVEPLIFQVVGVQFEPLVEDEFDHAG